MENERKFPMRNYNSELSRLFKQKMDQLGIHTYQELADKSGVKLRRTYTDFFVGKCALTKEMLENTFKVLEIPIEDLEKYVEPVIKYKIIPIDPNGRTNGRDNYRQTQEYKEYHKQYYKEYYKNVTKPRKENQK